MDSTRVCQRRFNINEIANLLFLFLPPLILLIFGQVWYMQYNDSQRQVIYIKNIVRFGELPPEETILAGLKSIYPWGFHLLCAVTKILTGIPSVKIFEFVIILSFYLLSIAVYSYLKKVYPEKAAIGTALAINGCNLAWLIFLIDVLRAFITKTPVTQIVPTFYFNYYTEFPDYGKISYFLAYFTNAQLNSFAIVLFLLNYITKNRIIKVITAASLVIVHPVYFLLSIIFSPVNLIAGIVSLPFVTNYLSLMNLYQNAASTVLKSVPLASFPYPPTYFLAFGVIGIGFLWVIFRKLQVEDVLILLVLSINKFFINLYSRIIFQPIALVRIAKDKDAFGWVTKYWYLGVLTPLLLWGSIITFSIIQTPDYLNGFEIGYWTNENLNRTIISIDKASMYLAIAGSRVFVSTNLKAYYGDRIIDERYNEVNKVLNECKQGDMYIVDSTNRCNRETMMQNVEYLVLVP